MIFDWTPRNREDPQQFRGLSRSLTWLLSPFPLAPGITAGGTSYLGGLIFDWTAGRFIQSSSFLGTTISWLSLPPPPPVPVKTFGDGGRKRKKKPDLSQANVVSMIEALTRLV